MSPQKGPTILLVADAPDPERLIPPFARLGYRLLTASSADEALGHLGRAALDLVVVDDRPPRPIDGPALYARAQAAGTDLPAFLLIGPGGMSTVLRELAGCGGDSAAPGEDLARVVERALSELSPDPAASGPFRSPRWSEQFLRQVWDRSRDGMRLADERGVIRLVNPAYCEMVGLSRESLEGQSLAVAYAEQDRESLLALYRERFHSPRVEPMYYHDLTLWNGRKVNFELTNSFVELPDEPPLLLSVFRDITARVALEGRLRQSQKMEAVGRLAGGVAHDFNNLLTVINGCSELLLEALHEDEANRELVAEISRAGRRAASLTRQLLAFSRKQILAPRVIDLNVLVQDMHKLLARLIGEDVELSAVTTAELWPVKVDPGGMEQVIINLVINARDAMLQGGKLTIETRNVRLDEEYTRSRPDARPGPHVLLAVSDTGCGMDAETLGHVFEPFFTTKGDRGTGLGLATVYGVVKQSGGHVAVYSEPGNGSTFKVYLPRSFEWVSTGKSHHGASLMPSGTETVLLVEDDTPIRTLACNVLTGCGYRVLEAPNGRRALELAGGYEGPIDLLVTDVVMPELGGRQLAEEICALRPGLKVLYLSGYTDDAVVRHGVLEDEVAFLHKPFTMGALAQKVRQVLDGSGAATKVTG